MNPAVRRVRSHGIRPGSGLSHLPRSGTHSSPHPLRESMALTAVIRGVSAPSFVLYSKRMHADSVKESEWLGNG